MNVSGVPNELSTWMFNAHIQMISLNNRMKEAQNTGNNLDYYQLKNEAILKRIEIQKGTINLRSGDSHSILNHEKIAKLFLQLTPLKERAEARTQFDNCQFRDSQIQKNIDDEFNQAHELLKKTEKQLIKLMQFKKQHSVPLGEERAYLLNDQTKCHNPGCEETKFTKTLMKCSRCQKVLYCGRLCQKNDWKTHKLICR